MARSRMKAKNLQRLLDERDRLFEQMEALKYKIGGLELAITLLEKDDDEDRGEAGRQPRGNAKKTVIELLRQAGTTGLNATSAVEMAAARNMELARGTAASTLSRLKADGIVSYDGDRYRLNEFLRPKLTSIPTSA